MPILHFSFDDIALTLRDLCTQPYVSAFQQPFLAALKAVHQETGAVFTLFCFNQSSEAPGYDIGDLPDSWQGELSQAKAWLRWGFHAEDNRSRYAQTPGVRESYDRCVAALRTLTGDDGCIDPILRLGFFSGNAESVAALRGACPPVTGLYAADDDRLSYCLDEERNNRVIREGRLDDPDTRMTYIRTLPRLDGKEAEMVIHAMADNPFPLTEVFMHEYTFVDKPEKYAARLTAIARWANEHGYAQGFHSDALLREARA